MRSHSALARILQFAILLAALNGCTPSDQTAWRPEAPETYEMAAKQPQFRSFPEFGAQSATAAGRADGRGRAPKLPPLQQPATSRARSGLRPLQVTVGGPEGERSVPPRPNALATDGMQPLSQLIYGGSHPDRDSSGRYQFHVRDRIAIHVAEHPEFSGEVDVLQDGSVNIPNTDDYVEVQGMDVDQVRRAITDKIAPYIKGPPQVKVNIAFGRGEYYYVFGEVRNQGRFPMGITPIRLSEAVFRANSNILRFGGETGLTREERFREEMELSPREGYRLPTYADLMHVSVITPHRSHPTRRVYNVKSPLLQGVTGKDPVLRSGEIVFVPSTVDARIIRFFNRVIAPIAAVGEADAEAAGWYGRITGNRVKGRRPKVYEVK